MTGSALARRIRTWLSHPRTAGLDLDDPATTDQRRQIVLENQFLSRLYAEWYAAVMAAIPTGPGRVLELGSGPGFFEQVLPEVITSDVISCRGIALMLDAHRMPLPTGALRAIVMTNVFHHLRDPLAFLDEAMRCLRPGGRVIMVEPWVTAWSTFVYQGLHHEPFKPDAAEWALPPGGPLSGANGALPWIMFQRDRRKLLDQRDAWEVAVRPWMPFSYLLSGGVSMRPLMPGAAYGLWRAFESLLRPLAGKLAMFAVVTLTYRGAEATPAPFNASRET